MISQHTMLTELAVEFSKVCNMIVPYVIQNRCWNRVRLHHLVYYDMRILFPSLGSQMICQAIHRVADAYTTLKANKGIPKDSVPCIAFKSDSVNFDKRTYTFQGDSGDVSLFTLHGRKNVKFICGKHQKDLIKSGELKEARLIIKNKQLYFNLFLDLPDPQLIQSDKVLGVDIGENNLAATSSGKLYGGKELRDKRDRYLHQRSRLQSNGSRASKRKLKIISGREQRHVKHINHEVSKSIIQEAMKCNVSEIRMEDLTNIRANIKGGKRIKTRLHRWAFRQLQDFTKYKAEGVGMKVMFVNPAYTSQTCSVCGGIGKREKYSFSCLCGTKRHSDVNAALNIAEFAESIGSVRGAVNRPKFADQK